MPGSAEFVQRLVHTLETGKTAIWLRCVFVAALIGGISLFYLLYDFRGLATSQAMDQAQMAREIARGHFWQTKYVRPRAIAQLLAHGKNVPRAAWVDTYNAPLPPLVNAFALFPIRSHWKMSSSSVLYPADYAIAAMSIVLFLLSVVVLFFIARRLFDQRLAFMASALLLLCNMFWQYALSGLPQMLMLLLFNCTIYALIRAVDAQYGGGRVGIWLALVGFGFALLALSNAITIWIFVAALVVFAFFFRPRGWAALIALVIFGIVYFPWLLRNYVVCGNPAGIAFYSMFDGMGHPEAGWMRHMNLSLEGLVGPLALRDKVITNFSLQAGNLFGYLGYSVVAIMFFAALVYAFRRPETRMVRWILAAMWVGAVAGMSVFGLNEEQGVAANQLHLLFVPVMTCYGLAFLLVLWRRLEIRLRVARIGFITLLFVLCALPFIFRLPGFKPTEGAIRWPPYVPPYIAVLNDWMRPNEITASDMPWAVAWYADRPSLLLPETIKEMIDISDYRVLGGPVNGLYITPVSGSENKLDDIIRGEYKAWAAVIFRGLNMETFPLKWVVSLGLDNECIFFSDHNRQETTGTSP